MVPNCVKHLIFQTSPSTSKAWCHDEYSHTRRIVRIGVSTSHPPLKKRHPRLFCQAPPLNMHYILVFREPPPLKYQSFLSFTSFFLLKVTKFLVKISEFEFLVMTEKNIFAYKLFLLLHISDFNLFLCENCNPLKSHPLLPSNLPLRVKVLSSPSF